MADKVDPRTGELTTANFGWVKPTVGASVDAWGGYINTDLDGIDSTVHGIQTSVPAASSTTPAMDGTAAVGTGTTFARADHVHPVDTSRYAVSNPNGYQTAAQVTAAVPVASSTTPLGDGTAAVGTGTTWARADHVHPLPSQMIGDNRLINGDMRIDQRNAGASGTTGGYTVDRWSFGANQNKGAWGRSLNSVASLATTGFSYYLGFQSSSAYTPLAGDFFNFNQTIEADMVCDFAWGTANAQPVTLSFWAQSSLTGTFSGAIIDYAGTRAYPFTYSLPTANTWTKIVVTVPGDTSGAWVMSGNGGALYLQFDLGSGANCRKPAGAWVAGAFINGANGAVNIVATNAAKFYVTGVKLEIGSVATPFNRQSLAKSMADCQRYYQKIGGAIANDLLMQAYASAASLAFSSIIGLPVSMRSAPTVTPVGITLTACTASYFGGLQSIVVQLNSTGVANIAWNNNTTAAYLTASAEL